MKPPIKWPGGKRWLTNRLEPLYKKHAHRPFVELFCGGCALSFGFEVERAILNDLNIHLINFFWHIQDGNPIGLEMENDRDMYYEYRGRFNQIIQDGFIVTKEAAGLFYYLNKTGFNGLFRVNKNGMYNVPFGKYKSINYQTEFPEYEQQMRHWEFLTGDFEDLPVEAGMFVYSDPPYDDGFDMYTKEGFTWADQVRLARHLAKHQGPVVASNKATPRIVSLYMDNGFDISYEAGPRAISSDGNRDRVLEIVATKGV